jgi:site-specific DNA-cytosine methylase
MKYFSVCDGIGAAHAAFLPLGWECTGISETDKYCNKLIKKRYGFYNFGDFLKWKEWHETYTTIWNKVEAQTQLECERCFGFPDGYTEVFSDYQRYKMLGNSMAVPVVRWIGERIERYKH